MDIIPKYNVVHKLQKRSLLIAINCVAGLSIFFFGYDQGMMGGVNNAVDYYQNTMKFGVQDPVTGFANIQDPLLQGGIVSLFQVKPTSHTIASNSFRSLSTTLVLSSAVSSVALSVTAMVVSRQSPSVLPGLSSVLLCKPRRKITPG